MRADSAAPRVVSLAVVAGACLVCRLASADSVPINLDVQYQRIETLGETRQYWSRNMDLAYTRRLSPTLQFSSQFRLNALDYVNRPEGSFSPYGALRLEHPFAGFNLSHRPSRSTNSADITTRQKETQFSGFVAPSRLPRLDVQWTRQRQEPGNLSRAGTGITRSGRLSWALGGFELRGGAGDLAIDPDDSHTRVVSQRNWDAGLSYRAARAGWSLHGDADLGDVRHSADGSRWDRNRTRGGLFEFSQKLSRRMDANITYQYRGVDAGVGADARSYNTHDGSATWTLKPTRATQVLVGGGVRPVTLESGSTRTLGYALVSGIAQGRVRAGWTGISSVSQSLNRRPNGHAYRVGAYRAGSRLILAHGLNLDLDGTVTANGDTAVRDQRTTTVTTMGITATPLRRITFMWNLRGYRSGPSLSHSSAHSNSRVFDLSWQPVTGLDLGANLARSGALPKGEPTLTTRRFLLRLIPTTRFQADLDYSRSDQSRQDTGTGRLAGREVWTGRLLAGLGRRFRVSAGGALSDPGKPTRSRQVDVTVSTRLGGAS